MPLERLTMLVLPGRASRPWWCRRSRRRGCPRPATCSRSCPGRTTEDPDRAGRVGAAGEAGPAAPGAAPSPTAPGPPPARPPASAPVGRWMAASAGDLPGPGGQGRRRARRPAGGRCRRRPGGRRLQDGEIPLVGRTEAEVSAEHRLDAHRRRPPAGQLRHRRQRAQCGQPPPRARPTGDRAVRDRRLRLRRQLLARRRRGVLLGHHPHRGDRSTPGAGRRVLRGAAGRPAGRGRGGPGRCGRRAGRPRGPRHHRRGRAR